MPQVISPIPDAGHHAVSPTGPAEPARASGQSPACPSPGGSAVATVTPDEQVIRRVLAGDIACFELIMRRYNQRLFRVARSILSNDSDAQDAVQEAYLQAYGHLSQFEGRATFATWLTRIAVHAALRLRRERKRMSPLEPDQDDAAESWLSPSRPADQAADNHELGTVLSAAIERLPTELRTVFTLRIVEDLDTQETAQCLQLSEANVKTRLHRARALLRQDIDQRIGIEARRLYQFDGQRCDRLVAAVLNRLNPDCA